MYQLQNKNWLLFTTLVIAVTHLRLKRVRLNFLETGHTYMASDAVHGKIETKLRRTRNVYDFPHLLQVCERSSVGCNMVVPLAHSLFRQFEDQTCKRKLAQKTRPKLANMTYLEFRKGSRNLFYGLSHSQEVPTEFEFLREDCSLDIPDFFTLPRGLKTSKKEKICKNILPLMPQKHHSFWNELPVSEVSEDLLSCR